MRRDVVVEVSSRGMIKTGLKSDVCQVCFCQFRVLLHATARGLEDLLFQTTELQNDCASHEIAREI